jgi:acyl-CoA hydrolase
MKTFFSGWVADEAVHEGQVDLIPSRFVKIPQLIESLLRHVDVAIVQISPPSEAGFCSRCRTITRGAMYFCPDEAMGKINVSGR